MGLYHVVDKDVRKNGRHLMEIGVHDLGYGYKEWGNMGSFKNLIVVSGFYLL